MTDYPNHMAVLSPLPTGGYTLSVVRDDWKTDADSESTTLYRETYPHWTHPDYATAEGDLRAAGYRPAGVDSLGRPRHGWSPITAVANAEVLYLVPEPCETCGATVIPTGPNKGGIEHRDDCTRFGTRPAAEEAEDGGDDGPPIFAPMTGFGLFLAHKYASPLVPLLPPTLTPVARHLDGCSEVAMQEAREVWPEAEGFERVPGGWTFRVGAGYASITDEGVVATEPQGTRNHAKRFMGGGSERLARGDRGTDPAEGER